MVSETLLLCSSHFFDSLLLDGWCFLYIISGLIWLALTVGPDLSVDQTNHTKNTTGLVTHGHSHRVWHGYCYGGKRMTDTRFQHRKCSYYYRYLSKHNYLYVCILQKKSLFANMLPRILISMKLLKSPLIKIGVWRCPLVLHVFASILLKVDKNKNLSRNTHLKFAIFLFSKCSFFLQISCPVSPKPVFKPKFTKFDHLCLCFVLKSNVILCCHSWLVGLASFIITAHQSSRLMKSARSRWVSFWLLSLYVCTLYVFFPHP